MYLDPYRPDTYRPFRSNDDVPAKSIASAIGGGAKSVVVINVTVNVGGTVDAEAIGVAVANGVMNALND